MRIVARFELDFPVPAKIAMALLIRFPKFPPKIMAPSVEDSPLHSENGRTTRSAKQETAGSNRKLRETEITLGCWKHLHPQNETLKASSRRRTAVGVNSLPRGIRKPLESRQSATD